MDTVNENAFFESDDDFHRIDFVQKAMKLIGAHEPERGACVIDIDAPWGMGKTTLLKMWINELDKGNASNYSEFKNMSSECVYYNAWENDYNSDALTPLIYTICGSIYIKSSKTGTWLTTFRDKMKAMITTASGVFASYLCYQNTGNELLATGVGSMATAATDAAFHIFEGREPEEIGENYSKELEKRNAFHKAVSELANACGKLFIFIDELDRCKPTFAIQTLECIKHYFNIPNVVFIFATDISQLANTIETYYGHGMDAGGYFLKFFDHIMHLPVPNIRELMHFAYPTIKVDAEFYEYFNEIRKTFILTPRETPWLIRRAKVIWERAFKEHRKVNISASFAFVTFLLVVKTKKPDRFLLWVTKGEALSDLYPADDQTFISQCVKLSHGFLTIQIDELEEKVQVSDEQHRQKRAHGTNADEEITDFEDLFLQTIHAVCTTQMEVSQTVGEALLASLELC